MDSFTDEECEKLIDLVSQHPVLFDTKNFNYKNPTAKDDTWTSIAQELNTTSESCKRHWKTIRDGYKRYKRRSNLPTGLVAPKNRRTKWKIYRQLSFLDKIPQEVSSIGLDESSLDESESPQHTPEEYAKPTQIIIKQEQDFSTSGYSSPPFKEIRPSRDSIESVTNRKRSYTSATNDDILKYIKESERTHFSLIRNLSQNYRIDEFNSFSSHIEHVLKKLPSLLKIRAKKEIFEVLTKYEMMAVDDSTKSEAES